MLGEFPGCPGWCPGPAFEGARLQPGGLLGQGFERMPRMKASLLGIPKLVVPPEVSLVSIGSSRSQRRRSLRRHRSTTWARDRGRAHGHERAGVFALRRRPGFFADPIMPQQGGIVPCMLEMVEPPETLGSTAPGNSMDIQPLIGLSRREDLSKPFDPAAEPRT